MARPEIAPVSGNAVVDKNFSVLREILCGGISFDNMYVQTVSGTTSSDVDSENRVTHSMNPPPIGWFPLIGDVYVQEITTKHVDVRSTKPEVNFKIVLIGGSALEGATVSTIGGEGYQDSSSGSSGGITLPEIMVAQSASPTNGTTPGAYLYMVNDPTYFYVVHQGSGANTLLIRVNKTTKISDSLTLGTRALGPMVINGTNLYVAQLTGDGVDTVVVFVVDLVTFTTTSTLSMTGAGVWGDTNDITVDAANIYICGTNLGVPRTSKALKCPIAGGASTALQLVAAGGQTRVPHKIIDDGTFLWIMHESATVANVIIKVTKSAFTIATTFTVPGPTSNKIRTAYLLDSTIIIPVCSAGSNTTIVGNYVSRLMAFDTITGSFTQDVPVPLFQTENGNWSATTNFVQNIIYSNGYVYTIQGGETYAVICKTSVDTRQYSLSVIPIPPGRTGGDSTSRIGLNTVFQVDASNGDPLFIYQPSVTTAAPQNFQWSVLD